MRGSAIIRGAAERPLAAWRSEERPAIGDFRYEPPRTTACDPATGTCDPNISYGYVAQVVDVALDVEIGHVFVERVVCANDVGKALNPNLVEGQIEGHHPGARLRHQRALATARRPDPEPAAQYVSDAGQGLSNA